MKTLENFKGKCLPVLMKVVSVCSVMALIINSNSTSCMINGQPEPPKSLRKYRKF